MNTKNKVTMGIAVAIFVAAIVGVVVGVTTHEEPGLIEGVPTWEPGDFPLAIEVSSYRADAPVPGGTQSDRMAVARVVSRVNRRLGFDAFRVPQRGSAETIRVVLVIGVPYDATWDGPGGDSQIRISGGRAGVCEIRTSNTGTNELLALTIYHELGHCLGLAHDDFDDSIMRAVQRPTPDRQIPPWFTDYDRELLRDLYAP